MYPGTKDEIKLKVFEAIEREQKDHRLYLISQFRMLIAGLSIVGAAAGFSFVYFAGDTYAQAERRMNLKFVEAKNKLDSRVSDEVIKFTINEKLKQELDRMTSSAVNEVVYSDETQNKIRAVVQNKASVYLEGQYPKIRNQLELYAREKAEEFNGFDMTELVKSVSFPTDSVVGFASTECPNEWSEYEPAKGNFLRGINPKSENVRRPRDFQEDALQGHIHKIRDVTAKDHGPNVQAPHGYQNGAYGVGVRRSAQVMTDPNYGEVRVDNETRPDNTAVLFCIKD